MKTRKITWTIIFLILILSTASAYAVEVIESKSSNPNRSIKKRISKLSKNYNTNKIKTKKNRCYKLRTIKYYKKNRACNLLK